MSTKDYVRAYLATIKVTPHNTKRLFAIGMIGMTGSGKSTYAEALGKRLNLFVGSNDHIRRWLNSQGFAGESPAQELVQMIGESGSRYLYEQGISHIIDADLVKFYDTARRNAESFGAEFFLVHITAPEGVIMKRLKEREAAIASGASSTLSRVGTAEYLKRKQLHEKLGHPDDLLLNVDTSGDIMQAVEKTVELLKQKDVI